MNRIIIFLFLVLMLSGCSGSSKKNQIAGMVCEWQGKTIVLPDGIVDFNSGDFYEIVMSNEKNIILTDLLVNIIF